MNKHFLGLVLVVMAVGAIAGGIVGNLPKLASADTAVTDARITSDYKEALETIDANFPGQIDHEKLTDNSMQAMLWTLDPHSAFFSREELRKLDEEQASEFYGIGVSILQHRDGVYVQSIVPNTPADKAGLRYGDRILTVDGKDAKEWTSSEVSKNVRGPRGTTVKLQIERVNANGPVEFDITRGGVPLPSIRNYFMLRDNIGYIGLTGGFQTTTGQELTDAMTDLKKLGMKNLILDLRGNPGGILDQAIAVTSKFVQGGQTVVSVKGAATAAQRELRATGGTVEDIPLVVMINGGSASASEIVAGAIQDYDRGVIVGSDSFGKGLVQRVFRLPYGTGMTLTTARYYTPFGRSLQRDYSTGSIYDYYTHGEDTPENADLDVKPKPAGSPISTANGRVLFGGRGIEPDIVAQPAPPSAARGRVNEAAFFFVRQLAAGKIAGFENFRVDRQSFKETVGNGEFAVADRLFEAFRTFAVSDPKLGLTADNINSQAAWARTRLREEIATANYSNEAGVQVLLEVDPQVLKAIDAMPKATELAAMISKK